MQLALIYLMIDLSFLYVVQKNIFIIACFGYMWSDHIFYCRPKLIMFQHNGLLKYIKIAWCLLWDTSNHYHLLNNIGEKHRSCILIYHIFNSIEEKQRISTKFNALIKSKLCAGTDTWLSLKPRLSFIDRILKLVICWLRLYNVTIT